MRVHTIRIYITCMYTYIYTHIHTYMTFVDVCTLPEKQNLFRQQIAFPSIFSYIYHTKYMYQYLETTSVSSASTFSLIYIYIINNTCMYVFPYLDSHICVVNKQPSPRSSKRFWNYGNQFTVKSQKLSQGSHEWFLHIMWQKYCVHVPKRHVINNGFCVVHIFLEA